MPTWTFVRHGQSIANAEGWFAGHTDAPLTKLGQQQAIDGRRDLPSPLPPRAFCSDLSRAHSTASLLLADQDIPLVVTPALRERYCGSWERRSTAELDAMPEIKARFASWRGRPPGGGESLFDVALRVATWAVTIDDCNDDTLVVAHGALMRAIFAAIDRQSRDQLDLERPRNCQAISRSLERGQWATIVEELRAEATQQPDSPSVV